MVVRSIRARSLFSIFLYLAKHDMSSFYLFFVARFNVFTFSYIHSNHYHFFSYLHSSHKNITHSYRKKITRKPTQVHWTIAEIRSLLNFGKRYRTKLIVIRTTFFSNIP